MLPLNLPTKQALKALHCLAGHSDRWILASALSACSGVPTPTLSKVMGQLVHAEIVDAKRGHRGGYRLLIDPTRLSLATIAAALGGAPRRGPCAIASGDCDPRHPCPLHDHWREALDRTHAQLSRTTLAQYVEWRVAREEELACPPQQAESEDPGAYEQDQPGGARVTWSDPSTPNPLPRGERQ
jgi:Rrf2 family transcriptional regulator, iron-sulfur cluster assembly transcription factor